MDEAIIELVRNWIKRAQSDYKTAKDELATEDPATDTICFHCQQCAEKYLKAFLTANQKYFPKTHNIGKIINLCVEVDPSFGEISVEKPDRLTEYAVSMRYGEEYSFPTVEDAKVTFELSEKIRNYVINKLKNTGFESAFFK